MHDLTRGANSIFKCQKCDKSYKSLSCLSRHMRLMHSNDRPSFVCDHCGYSTKIKWNLAIHIMRMHKRRYGVYKCTACRKSYQSHGDLDAHARLKHEVAPVTNIAAELEPSLEKHQEVDVERPTSSHADRLILKCYKCKRCRKVYKHKGKLNQHLRWQCGKDARFFCDNCARSFKNKGALASHMKAQHDETGKNSNSRLGKVYQCQVCCKTYKHQSGLYYHKKTEHGTAPSHSCDHCSYTTVSKSHLHRHIREMHVEINQVYQCRICCKAYKQQDSLNAHMRVLHGPSGSFFCDYCGLSTKWKWNLVTHIKAKHDETGRSSDSRRGKAYQCQICYKTYKCPSGLYYHEKIKHGTAPSLSCDHCSYSTKLKSHLVRHIEAKHDGTEKNSDSRPEMAYECQTCCKTYKHQASLRYHKKAQHGTAPSIFCDHCSYSTVSKSNIRKHIEEMHGEIKQVYQCQFCCKTYKHRSSFYHHKKVKHGTASSFFSDHSSFSSRSKWNLAMYIKAKHDETGKNSYLRPEMAYQCQICCKTYKSLSGLYYHKKAEHDTTPSFSCDDCSYSTKRKSYLVRHIEAKHDETRSPKKCMSDMKPEKMYECRICGKTYKYRRNLYRHKKAKHGTAPSFFCDHCSYSTVSKSNLRRHIEEMHVEIKQVYQCRICCKAYKQQRNLNAHMRVVHGRSL